MQSLINLIYPQQCVSCEEQVAIDTGLCGSCWSGVHFVGEHVCGKCGVPLMGDTAGKCDECLKTARPWRKGRSAIVYEGLGKSLTLKLKHGDRSDLIPMLSQWVTQSAQKIVTGDALVVPVPLHWSRLLSRKYNQAGLIAAKVAKNLDLEHAPQALIRTKKTILLKGLSRDERFSLLEKAIQPHPVHGQLISGRNVLLLDDVMTTGATMAACAEACKTSGAAEVNIVTLARAQKDPYVKRA